MPNTAQVTAGKPKTGGHVYRAPLGTSLPTDALTELDSAFIDMGYISESGVTNSNSPESSTVNAWGGTPVLRILNSKDDTYKLQFISAMNPEVQKMVYGDSNVEGTDVESGLTVKANSKELVEYCYVIDMLAKGDVLHRVVIPNAKPTEIGDIVYNDSDPVGYDVTLGCNADNDGNTHYEYWQKAGDTPVPPTPTPTTPSVTLDQSELTLAVEATEQLTATTEPEGETVTWTSSDDEVATVEDGLVTAVAVGEATITASITVEEQEYTSTCTVTVTE